MTSHAGALAPSTGLDLTTAAALPPDEVLKRLGSSGSGLSGAEAAGRLERYGPNVVGVHRVRALAVLWGQLRNPLLLLLDIRLLEADQLVDAAKALTGASRRPPAGRKPDKVTMQIGTVSPVARSASGAHRRGHR